MAQPTRHPFIKKIRETGEIESVYLYGKTGYGKTVTLYQCAHYALKLYKWYDKQFREYNIGTTVLYYPTTKRLVELLNDYRTREETIGKALNCGVLILDNFFRYDIEAKCATLFDILERRFPDKKVWFGSNGFSEDTLTPSIYRRMKDFCGGNIYEFTEKLFDSGAESK